MKVNLRTFCLVAIAACFLASAMRADTLRLKNGRTVEGKYLGGTDSEITFYSNGKLEHFPIDQAVQLTFGYATSPSSATKPALENLNSQPAASANASSAQPVTPKAAADSSASATANSAISDAAQTVLVPAGTTLTVRMIDGVNSSTNHVGDTFRASLEDPLIAGGTQIAPRGSTVFGRIDDVSQAGNIKGQSELSLELTSIQINKMNHPIQTGDYQVVGKSRGRQTAERTGVGAALGGIIGAIAGGGKGAAIGAGVGAGAGAGTQVITHGQRINVPSETVLNFTLEHDVRLPVSNSTAPVH